jgi:hypothetical protein
MIANMMKPSDSDVDSAVGSRTEHEADSEVPLESSRASEGVADPSRAPKPLDDSELLEYSRILGADLQEPDMRWVVREAFEAPLPRSWTEHVDEVERVYFFSQVTQESTWAHPMDDVYRELIMLVQSFRAEHPKALPGPRLKAVKDHLESAHRHAVETLEGWSGPYVSETGEYFYNEQLGVSTWVNPLEDFEYQLAVRQSVLHRCLLPDFAAESSDSAAGDGEQEVAEALRLNLQLGLRTLDDEGQMSSRSFYSARESSRSGNSERSLRELRDALNSPSLRSKSAHL